MSGAHQFVLPIPPPHAIRCVSLGIVKPHYVNSYVKLVLKNLETRHVSVENYRNIKFALVSHELLLNYPHYRVQRRLDKVKWLELALQ